MPNILVTGGSRGIGLAIVQRLAKAGHTVIAAARKESAPLQDVIKNAGGKVHFRSVDLNTPTSLAEFALSIRKDIGPVWGLVNNAGIGTEGLLAAMTEPQISELLRVNVESPILLAKFTVRQMIADGNGGRIINMGSIIGRTGYNALSVYGATKAAMEGFSRSLAREVGKHGITVNVVAPGFISTELTAGMGAEGLAKIAGRSALKRLPEAEDVAAIVDFLLAETGRNITGTVMTVDAGNTA